jgi:hypothetical protein
MRALEAEYLIITTHNLSCCTSNSSCSISELMTVATSEEGLHLWEKERYTRDAVDIDVRTRQAMLQRVFRQCCPTLGNELRVVTPALDRWHSHG